MQDTKSLPPSNQCQAIRDLYRSLQPEYHQLARDREEAGRRVDELGRQFQIETDAAEKRRLSEEIDDAVRVAVRLNGDFRRLEQQQQDYENDYDITGCREVLGSL